MCRIFGNRYSNTIRSYGRMGINAERQDSLIISANNIEGPLSGSSSVKHGVDVNYVENVFTIENNTINVDGQALNVSSYSSSTNGTKLIRNNMVISQYTGIILNNIDSIKIYHNSISVQDGEALYIDNFNPDINKVDIRNNIFISENAEALHVRTSPDSIFSHMDHNLYHSNGPVLIRIGNSMYNNLNTYKSASPQFNSASIDGDPMFIDPLNDLYFLGGSIAYDRGDTMVNVTEDIDGDPRPYPGSRYVDIGADEFFAHDLNSAVVKWNEDPLCDGSIAPSVQVYNLGADTIRTLKLMYSINGVWDSLLSNQSIAPSSYENIALNQINFASGAVYNIEVFSKMPNGLNDGFTANDTLRINLQTGLAGNFTINQNASPSNTNFQSFTALEQSLNQYGICGPVTVDVVALSGPYSERVFFDRVSGSSPVNTVTINGNGNVIYSNYNGTAMEGTLNFTNSSYFTIDGLNIQMDGKGFGVHMMDTCQHITINSCDITLMNSDTSGSAGILVANYSSINQPGNSFEISLLNNVINGKADYGIIYINPSNSLSMNNVIRDNKINDVNRGIYTLYHDSLIIEHNIVDFLDTINVINGFGSGIYSGGNLNSIINGNIVRNCYKGSSYTAITGANSSYSGNNYYTNNLIYNNKIHSGIGGNNLNYFYNNTVSMEKGTVNAPSFLKAISAYDSSIFINNLIKIKVGGTGPKIGVYTYSNSPFIENYNSIYIDSSTTGTTYYGKVASVSYSTLSAWQAGTGQGVNSMQVDPQFRNPAQGDFTPQNTALQGTGTPLAQVTEDLYGNPRLGNPDIGAIAINNPVGIEEENGEASVMLFPNPSQGLFTLVTTPLKEIQMSLTLMDMKGQLLYEKHLKLSSSHMESLDFTHLPKGIYLFRISSGEKQQVKKLVIQ